MSLGVIAEQVPSLGSFAYEIWADASKSTDEKKSRTHGVLVEQIKESRRYGGVRTIVKRECQSFRVRCMAQRRAE
jgi:hypothetical protein